MYLKDFKFGFDVIYDLLKIFFHFCQYSRLLLCLNEKNNFQFVFFLKTVNLEPKIAKLDHQGNLQYIYCKSKNTTRLSSQTTFLTTRLLFEIKFPQVSSKFRFSLHVFQRKINMNLTFFPCREKWGIMKKKLYVKIGDTGRNHWAKFERSKINFLSLTIFFWQYFPFLLLNFFSLFLGQRSEKEIGTFD